MASALPARAESYRLVLPPNAPAPVRFGAEELAQSLVEAGHHPGGGHGATAITVTTNGPGGPEAFVIQRRGMALRVAGGDAVGAMYGLIEVGEQAAENPGRGLLLAVRPTIARPYLPLRIDSPTLGLGTNGELPRLLDDHAFWPGYLAALARGRFNVLHLHGFVDPASGQRRSLLERLMPAAGLPDGDARRFVNELRSLAALCRDRGIRLALTDEAASDAPAAAVSAHRLLAAVPGLWGLGARVSGPGAAALSTALARTVAPRAFLVWPEPARRELAVGSRLSAVGVRAVGSRLSAVGEGKSVPTDSQQPTADSQQPTALPPLPRSALTVLPVNAGSFALPYPLLATEAPVADAQTGGKASDPEARLSPAAMMPFADPRFLRSARPGGTRLLWDVPVGRVAPALPWCDPDFIRRLVRSTTRLSSSPTGAQGLVIEPPASVFSSLYDQAFRRSGVQAFGTGKIEGRPVLVDSERLNAQTPERLNARTPERPNALQPAWWWHHTWGRLAYDPSETDRRLQAAFQRRYGQEPGWHVERVLARASMVVPLLAAVEGSPTAAEEPTVPEREPSTLEEWESSPWLDPHALMDVPAWARMRLDGGRAARLDPVQISFQLAQMAMRVRNEVDTIEILHPRRLTEWHELRREIEALCHLADFGARRLSAAAHLELHRRTGDEMELELASGHATLAQISWEAMQRLLAPGGEREVGHMTMPAEPPVPQGPFALDAAATARFQAALAQELALPRAAPRIAHVPLQRATPTRAQRITATVMSGPNPPSVTLAYRRVDREGNIGPEQERPMTRLFETRAFYQAEIQGPELTEGFLEYQIRATGGVGATTVWPGPEEWRRVPVTSDEAGPTIRPLSPAVSAGLATLSCEVTDPSGVAHVRLHLRPLTARAPWRVIEMTPAGMSYSAAVPLTREGLQYSFDAADAWGNRSVAPDVTTETPSLVLLPGAERASSVARSIRVNPGH